MVELTTQDVSARGYSYSDVLSAAERIHWRIDEVIGEGARLDFTKPFLPEALARVEPVRCLSAAERLTLNHIRAQGYLHILSLGEEFILPFVLDHTRPQLNADPYRVRAFLQFASEEAKHIQLFRRFREAFFAGFGSACGVIGPTREIARAVLAHHPLGVALAIQHLEWMTQSHYADSVQGDRSLDPQFTSLLKHHWMEEAQHAKLDALMLEAMAAACHAEEIAGAVDEYLAIIELIDEGLQQQVRFDLEALQRAIGRVLGEDERRQLLDVQLQATRWTFIGSGMSHPNFLDSVEILAPAARRRLEQLAQQFR
jgi:hypothetical protein